MAKIPNKGEEKSEFDFSPYWTIYPNAKILYLVLVQGSCLVFDTKLKAEKYQKDIKEMRGLESSLQEIQK